jgi:hypothetical protein
MKRSVLYPLLASVAVLGLLVVAGKPYSDESTEVSEGVAVRHALAAAELAEHELAIAEHLNQRVQGAVAGSRIDWLATNAELARERVATVQGMSQSSSPSLQTAYAEALADYVEREYERAKAVNDEDPAFLSDLQLERWRLKAEVTRLRAEMWREYSYGPLLVEQLQWQVDQMAEDLVQLNHRVEELD